METIVIIEKGKDGTYEANLKYYPKLSFGLFGEGKTVKQTIADFYRSYEDMKILYVDENQEIPKLEFDFKYDMASFLAYYGDVLSLAGLGRLTGINKGQLSHYVTGHRRPSRKTIERIEKKLHAFADDLRHVTFI